MDTPHMLYMYIFRDISVHASVIYEYLEYFN